VIRRGLADPSVRSRGWLLLAFVALMLLVINGSQWFVLHRVTASMERELGLRLATAARSATSIATYDLLLGSDIPDDDVVRLLLGPFRDENDLVDVRLVDRDGIVLFDLDGGGVGMEDPFVKLDRDAFERAVQGEATASDLIETGGAYLMAAYAPVSDGVHDPQAVLYVTAGSEFHEGLPALRRTFWAISIGSAVLVALLMLIFFRVLRRFAATDAALTRAETLSAMGMMAAGVAHEIRNPLAIISGTAARLRRKYGGTTEPPDELFDFIPEEVERLNGILEGYLRFARDEGMSPADCDLVRLVERCRGMVRDDFAARGVTVDVHGVDRPAGIHADALRVQQVLLNLLLNAVQAMPDGGRIDVAVEWDARHATVRVADSGPGFSAKALRGAFQPFFTTKEQGSGLGLTVARRIIEAHGGTITLANGERGGAVVTVDLPRVTGGAERASIGRGD
jgi:signal transduction histidine kinase